MSSSESLLKKETQKKVGSDAFLSFNSSSSPTSWSIEVWVYFVVSLIPFLYFIYLGINLSSETHPLREYTSRYLKPGWLFDYMIDTSDHQYIQFRSKLPLLLATFFGYSIYSYGIRRYCPSYWLLAITFFALIFTFVLHGQNVWKLCVCLLMNYWIAKYLKGSKWNPILTWTWNLTLLIGVQASNGLDFLSVKSWFNGVMPWQIVFRVPMLRAISFNMDYYWSHHESRSVILHNHSRSCPHFQSSMSTTAFCCNQLRTLLPHPTPVYSWLCFLSYVLYPPLYLSGPITTFNQFHSQRLHPSSSSITTTTTPSSSSSFSFSSVFKWLWNPIYWQKRSEVIVYGLRWCMAWFIMEVYLHTLHFMAITKIVSMQTTNQEHSLKWLVGWEWMALAMYSLFFVWLKLLIIWRFFRFFALLDVFEPPENMLTCVFNHYSVFQFWRDWHASFYRWNLRYIYLPLGGSKTKHWNMWLVFLFVAIWHDLQLHLIAWALLICLFFLPEMVVSKWFAKKPTHQGLWLHLSALGASFNILLMITANLVGFVVGMEGIQKVVQHLSWTLVFSCVVWFYVLARVMFQIREQRKLKAN